jgi:hypothetical protein
VTELGLHWGRLRSPNLSALTILRMPC